MTFEEFSKYQPFLAPEFKTILGNPDTWPLFDDNIQTHKYLLSENVGVDSGESRAITSWMEYLFEPLYYKCKKEKEFKRSSPASKGLTIIAIIGLWDSLKKENRNPKKEITITQAFHYYWYIVKPTGFIKWIHFYKYLLGW